MARPVVGSYTEELYKAFLPVMEGDGLDEDGGWPFLLYLDGIGIMTQEIYDYVRDTPLGPGWSVLVDIERAPDKGLPWLAQLAGVMLQEGMTPVQQRDLIRDMPALRRGTPASMRAAAQLTLEGDKNILITERFGGFAYRMSVITYETETPDPDATLAALLSQKPAGIVLTYAATSFQTWLTLRDGPPHTRTWQTVQTDYASWQLARDDQPPL